MTIQNVWINLHWEEEITVLALFVSEKKSEAGRHYVAKMKCESHSHRKQHWGMTTGGSAGGRAVKKGVEYAKRVETNKEMVLRVEDQHKSPS